MTSDVVLTAALRNNLLSLQKTQSQVDITQNRLATGKKINSALDGPQAFFASQALTNRASDLTRLLDSIGQSIQVIKAADNGVTALTKLVEQADSIAQSARDALAQGQAEAKVVGDRDLRGVNNLASLAGIAPGGTDIIRLSATNAEGVAINIGAFGGAANATVDITIAANLSSDELVAAINNINFQIGGAGNAVGDKVFNARLDESGQLEIKSATTNDFRVQFVTVANTDAADLATASALGFSEVARIVQAGGAANNNNVEFTAISDVALTSFALTSDNLGTVAQRSTLVNNLRNATATAVQLNANVDNANDDYLIGINGGTLQSINLTSAAGVAVTLQEFIDQINNNTVLNTKIRAEFDDTTGRLSIRTIDATVQDIQVAVGTQPVTAGIATVNFGFGRNGTVASTATNIASESIRVASAAGELAQFETDYDNIRDQIDQLVNSGDTGYRGTNLLAGDDLTTFFNENRTSSLVTSGTTFSADGLGLDAADFGRAATIDGALDQVRTALESVRNFGSSLATNLSIIQTRETFTSELINTLTEGADKLVNADQNEEGAKLLALQTRQSLGVTALSLASQSQQSILRLF